MVDLTDTEKGSGTDGSESGDGAEVKIGRAARPSRLFAPFYTGIATALAICMLTVCVPRYYLH